MMMMVSYQEVIMMKELNLHHSMHQEVLRKILKQRNSDGTIDYTSNDLNLLNNAEQVSLNHSPIIGWAYDGNPIYGPYGYDRKDGGICKNHEIWLFS